MVGTKYATIPFYKVCKLSYDSDSLYLFKKSIDNIHETCDKDFIIELFRLSLIQQAPPSVK